MSNFEDHFQTTLGSLGLKVDASSILDFADPQYSEVPEEIRAAAWLGAIKQGWTEDGIKQVARSLMGLRYDEDMVCVIIESLKEASQKHPNIL